LFELINGGADIYFEYGFGQVVSAQYVDPFQNHIQVEIYEMTDTSAAYGIYSITQYSIKWSKEFGTLSSVTDDYIAFWKDKYYVNLSWSSRQHNDKPLLAQLAGLVSGKIREDGDYPDLVKAFGLTESGIKSVYFKGNIALSNFYYFDYKDIFQIEHGLAWTQGEYHFILMKYTTPERAIEVLTSTRYSISNNKRFSDITNAFQGFSINDNKGNLILIRQIDEYIVLLISLEKNTFLVSKMDDISKKIEGLAR